MTYDPLRHHRRSARLRGYDYTQAGMYFVTICTEQRVCLFGNITDGVPALNDAGQMIVHWWEQCRNKFPSIELDASVLMPNHFHGIIVLIDRDQTDGKMDAEPVHADPTPPLSQVLQWFKTMTTNAYIKGVKQREWAPFPGKLWQRNYYEHIIRSERALNNIRNYIIANPLLWSYDANNPQPISPIRHEIGPILQTRYGFSDIDLDFVLKYDTPA